jgi:hypothetical protein
MTKQEKQEYKKIWKCAHREVCAVHRRTAGLKSYGITREDYDRMLVDQGFCCQICGIHQTELKKKLHIDHDHATGTIRGLLCSRCNLGIGHFDDNAELLRVVVAYLES